jgi:hypothetical protein
MSPLEQYLADDHVRLDALLRASVADPRRFDHDRFEEFRAGLLRHIGIEEKLLIARLRRRGEPLPVAKQLREDHAALASLMVPTPDHGLVREIGERLARHNALEEGAGGFYEECVKLLGEEATSILEQARVVAPPPLAPHFDSGQAPRHSLGAGASPRSARLARDGAP